MRDRNNKRKWQKIQKCQWKEYDKWDRPGQKYDEDLNLTASLLWSKGSFYYCGNVPSKRKHLMITSWHEVISASGRWAAIWQGDLLACPPWEHTTLNQIIPFVSLANIAPSGKFISSILSKQKKSDSNFHPSWTFPTHVLLKIFNACGHSQAGKTGN